MKLLSYTLIFVGSLACKAQFFVQQLTQEQAGNAQIAYVVTNEADTLEGRITSFTSTDSLISRFTLKVDDEKLKFRIEDIQSLQIIPGENSNYQDIALLPVLKEIDNDEFINLLPENGLVIYEKIRLPGRSERYALAQLLNPGFDSKVKVYVHPDASSNGSTNVNGLMLEGGRDDKHYISVNGEQTFVLNNFNYRKKSPELLYAGCSQLKDQKLKWKDFAKHVFILDQKCD